MCDKTPQPHLEYSWELSLCTPSFTSVVRTPDTPPPSQNRETSEATWGKAGCRTHILFTFETEGEPWAQAAAAPSQGLEWHLTHGKSLKPQDDSGKCDFNLCHREAQRSDGNLKLGLRLQGLGPYPPCAPCGLSIQGKSATGKTASAEGWLASKAPRRPQQHPGHAYQNYREIH